MKKIKVSLWALCALVVSHAAMAATTLEYAILKEGEPIGKEVVVINDSDKGVNVDVVTKTNVKMLFLEFNYEHQRREVWENGELVSMHSRTNDDGTHHEYSVTRQTDGLQVLYDGKNKNFDAKALPLSLWSKAALYRNVLFSVIDAEPFKTQTVALDDNHFKIDGDITRELWFADDGYLQKAAFKRKGFLIELLRK
ncbi:hypothetical protein GCM10011332_06070 [Terasakiella brassicae]|uniref:Uncharacterized protein n=1 Tax=Terasakiella brassicae TaxID=1634917 RepID=A0A917F7F1_9PROT|nr:DUF6134 family protein [Terasakiella brassicae]GGF55456.1 hypothetical protein GCM10011332_06070 [Terasakiella brassicae]